MGEGKNSPAEAKVVKINFSLKLMEYIMSSEIAHPSTSPKQAALQLVIELVRAGKLSPLQGDASNMLSIYEQFKAHFEADKQKKSSESAIS